MYVCNGRDSSFVNIYIYIYSCHWPVNCETSRLGRRPILAVAAALYTAAALLMMWSPNVWVLLAARLVDGVGVGLAVTTSPLYISEVSPADIRGELNMLPQLLGTSGVFLAYVMVFFLSLTSDPSWRLMLAVMSLPAAAYLLVALLFLPESPRWLVSRGRTRDAKRVLQRLRNRDDVSGMYIYRNLHSPIVDPVVGRNLPEVRRRS